MSVTLPQGLQKRYRVERELGRGGMGAVYLATDLSLDRLVALKVLPPEFAGDAGLRERFLRETRTAASFSHPNIVPVHHVEEDEGAIAFVMGFVEGESLAARVARTGPLDVRGIVRVLQDVAYALAYAHGRGVVHRDIKPDNIMIERATGRALVMDFGISRSITPKADTPGLTRVGEVVGTPEYMSPEQASGDTVDGRSDLYSLGLVAHFALTGRAPITDETTQKIIVRQLTEALPPSAGVRSDLPPALAEAIDKCCAKDPAARYASAEALVEVIDSAKLSGPEIPLPIRLFAQEAATLGLVIVFMSLLSFIIFVSIMNEAGPWDAALPVTLLVGILLTRILQVRAEAGRLTRAGFAVGDVVAGMHAVLDERGASRKAIAMDAVVRAKRRRTVQMSVVMLVASYVFYRNALGMRVQLSEHSYHTGPLALLMIFSAFGMAGIGTILLLRSPFRATIGERLFRLFWLGPLGRLFLRSAMKQKAGDAPAPRTSPAIVQAPTTKIPQSPSPLARPRNAAPASDDRLDRIEAILRDIQAKLDR